MIELLNKLALVSSIRYYDLDALIGYFEEVKKMNLITKSDLYKIFNYQLSTIN